MAALKIVGITDDVNECSLCGRSGLKRTVALEPVDGGPIVHYGTDCAAKALGWGESSASQTRVKKDAHAAQVGRDEQLERQRRAALPDTDATKWLRERAAEEVRGSVLKSYIYNDSIDAELRRRYGRMKEDRGRFPWEPRPVTEATVNSRALPDIPNKPGKTNWIEKAGGLPKLIERVAKHLRSEKSYTTSRAIATAVNWAKKMCSTGMAFGGKVKVGAKAQAAACKAVAEWEKKRGKSKLTEALADYPDDADLGELIAAEFLALLEAGPASVGEEVEADLADFPLEQVLAEMEQAGELDLTEACPLELSIDMGDAALLEAAKPTPVSHTKRRGGESLGSWGARLKRGDKAAQRAQDAKKTRSRDGSAKDPDFEKQHPRGRAGSWVLKQGAKGEDVRDVQRKTGAKADGDFGKNTAAAVRNFQRRRGLQVDGVVGAQTMAELRKRGAGKKVKPGAIKGKERKPTRKRSGKHKPNGLPGVKLTEGGSIEGVKLGDLATLPNGAGRIMLTEAQIGDLSLLEAFDPRQRRDRRGRWVEMLGAMKPDSKLDIEGVRVTRNRAGDFTVHHPPTSPRGKNPDVPNADANLASPQIASASLAGAVVGREGAKAEKPVRKIGASEARDEAKAAGLIGPHEPAPAAKLEGLLDRGAKVKHKVVSDREAATPTKKARARTAAPREPTFKQSEAVRRQIDKLGVPSREEWDGDSQRITWRVGVREIRKLVAPDGTVTDDNPNRQMPAMPATPKKSDSTRHR